MNFMPKTITGVDSASLGFRLHPKCLEKQQPDKKKLDISRIHISWEKEDIKVVAVSFIIISYLGFGKKAVLEMGKQENKKPQNSLPCLPTPKHLQAPKTSVVLLTTNLNNIMKLAVSREIKG